jgi:hypothetical protein
VLSHSYEGTNYLGPYEVMDELKKLLTGESDGVARSDLRTAHSRRYDSEQTHQQRDQVTQWHQLGRRLQEEVAVM